MSENLYSSMDRIWIHSNIYDFHATVRPTVRSTTLGELDEYIARLEKQIDDLKRPADEFIKAAGCVDYMDLSKKLFGIGESDATFDGCVKRTLSDVRFIRKLQEIKYNVGSLLQNSDFEEGVKNTMLTTAGVAIDNQMSSTEFRRAVQKTMYALVKGKDVSKQVDILSNQFHIDAEDLPKKQLTSSEGRLKEYAKKVAKKATKSLSQGQADSISEAFLQVFWLRYNEERIISTMTDAFLKTEAKRIADLVGERLSQATLGELANILGSLGEEGLAVVLEATGSGISVTVTGDKTEAEVARQMSRIVHNNEKYLNSYLLKTHHDQSKQSQTDLLLTVKGVTVKAQAKNASLEAMQKQLMENGWDYDKTMPYIRTMEGDRPLTELLQILTTNDDTHSAVLTTEDANAIAYLLANAAWFSYAGTVSDTHNRAVSKVDSLSGLSGVYQVVNNLMSIAIKDFMGVEIINNTLNPDASNIFFFIGNRIAFPTYLMLEEYRNQLRGVKAQLFKLTYHTSPLSGISPSNAKAYRENILASLDGEIPSRDRIGMDTEVGFEQGQKVLDNLIGHINFNFNIAKQLGTISYKF